MSKWKKLGVMDGRRCVIALAGDGGDGGCGLRDEE